MPKVKEESRPTPVPIPGGCHFLVERKRRYCKMLVKPGANFCGEHLSESSSDPDRIPCPYDPKHTCSSSKLKKHLEICNSKPATNVPEYLVAGINKGDEPEADDGEKLSLNSVTDEKLVEILEKIRNTFNTFVANTIEEQHLEHSVLGEELSNTDYGPSVLKHHIQNSSLVGHLSQAGLLQSDLTFVEFGSGRGSLSYWLCRALPSPQSVKLVLVDRASPRHKLDGKLKELQLKEMMRIRADIQDLKLTKVFSQPEHIVAVSKHLCGAATDLTLRCLTSLPSAEGFKLKGIMIALCCHHRCSWPSYVGKQFLQEQGFSREDFQLLTSISSWATCGFGKNKSDDNEHDIDEGQCHEFHPNDRFSRLGLDEAAREAVGRKAKRIIDFGRQKYLESVAGVCSRLKSYVDTSVSLENVMLISSGQTGRIG